ncbi:YopX family protein [Streptococcus uberis]|uniref:YopX family protein n=1 Tax=Streptococcus uberis TaxID=1349 RepID=UPI003D6B4303
MMFEVKSLVYTLRLARLTNRNDLVPSRTCSFDDIILMQSTGLFDKNGVEIFEGDVVRVTCEHPIDFPDCKGVVRMLEGRYMVCDDKTERCSELFSEIFSNEIIGNIYQNPDLLESVEE